MSKITLLVTLATLSNGQLDDDGSLDAFQAAYDNFKAERDTEESTIAAAVAQCFDAHKGASQNMPALVHGALRILNVTPSSHKTMEEKVLNYIRSNSDRAAVIDKKTKAVLTPAEAPRTRAFGIKKGVGGGVCRWSDVPEKTDA